MEINQKVSRFLWNFLENTTQKYIQIKISGMTYTKQTDMNI